MKFGLENGVIPLSVSSVSQARKESRASAQNVEQAESIDLPNGILSLWSGSLELRLAASDADLAAIQALRYRVFYEEMSANASAEATISRRDTDQFDDICDHILVVDHNLGDSADAIVGTYRLLRSSVANAHDGFYTAGEFDISCLNNIAGEHVELGRSCVDQRYRTRPTMQLLWRGIAYYVLGYDISLMFGCASLAGTDLDELSTSLSYLYQCHLAPPALRPRALAGQYVEMDRGPVAEPMKRRALAGLPPLIKGYLRLGGYVGDGAVIDAQFDTTDVCVIVKTDMVAEKYSKHYIRAFNESVEGGDT